jgi:hypothetical protein
MGNPQVKRSVTAFLGLIGLLAILVGCSIGNTAPDQVALHYSAGPFDSRQFIDCTPSGTRSVDGANDDHYYYPSGQRDFTFSGQQGADSAQLTSTTKDTQQINVSGTVKFTLATNCDKFTDPSGKEWPGGKLQMFHELVANKYGAAPTEDGVPMNGGWNDLLRNYIGASVDRATDNEALKYGLLELYSNPEKKAQWEKDVLAQVPTVLRQLTGGVDLFTINAVVLQKPDIAPELQAGLTAKQAAEFRAQAVDVDKNAASSFPGGIAAYQAYQQQQAINDAIKSGKVQILPVPSGVGVNITPR